VQVHCNEGVATHIGPEPCIGIREDDGEASAGEHTGQQLSHESFYPRCRRCPLKRKATRTDAPTRAPGRPGGVGEPGMCVRSLHGNREISGLTSRGTGLARIGKARSRSR